MDMFSNMNESVAFILFLILILLVLGTI
jgi:hypothetical protein